MSVENAEANGRKYLTCRRGHIDTRHNKIAVEDQPIIGITYATLNIESEG